MKAITLVIVLSLLLLISGLATVATIQILQSPNIITTTTVEVTQINSTWDAAWGTGFLVVLFLGVALIILACAWDDLK